jgi:UDP-N-acetylmuramoyl-tripeptide--D-alanyl-D-alanine ligase
MVKGSIESFDAHAQAILRVKPIGKKPFDIHVGVPGKHNAHNALAATAIGLFMKVPIKNIQKALASFQAASKRMQIQRTAQVTILNDTYNANPDSMLAALSTLQTMVSKGKKIAVFADMLELGDQAKILHQQIGKAFEKYNVDFLFTFGSLSKYIHDNAVIQTKAHFEEKTALIEYLLQNLGEDDIVLIKGSRGMKMEEVVDALTERLSQRAGR